MEDQRLENTVLYWNSMHKEYNRDNIAYDDWLEKFSDTIEKCQTPILDLGCGSGNNTFYLVNKGKKVIACDISENAIFNIKKNFPEIYDAKCFNMLDGMPFDDNTFEIIIADLSLHYFKEKETKEVIEELKRILKPDGYLIIRVNSINDINHGAGQGMEIEKHVYEQKDKRLKRFFDEADIRDFFKEFSIVYLGEETMSRYEKEKKLYRVCMQNIK